MPKQTNLKQNINSFKKWIATFSRQRYIFLLITATLATVAGNYLQAAISETVATQKLANKLLSEKQYKSAAIEYRRLALMSDNENSRSAYYWAAAYAYYLDQDNQPALKMLDYIDELDNRIEDESTLLRLECAMLGRDRSVAQFYVDSLLNSPHPKIKYIAQMCGTELALKRGDIQQAKTLLPPKIPKPIIDAIETYASGHDKNPTLGGILGMVPGMGYAYSGEYANALRSIIMNGIFIYGMVETGSNDDWGVFTVLTFFEITWYSGSIYGGVDSAHRYNQRRLQACLQVIDTHTKYEPDLKRMPTLSIRYSF